MAFKRGCIRQCLRVGDMEADITVELKDKGIVADIYVMGMPRRYAASTPEKLYDNILKVRPSMLASASTNDMERLAMTVLSNAKELVCLRQRRKEQSKTMSTRIDNLIRAAYERRDEIVLCLLGAPGIGKTEAVERFARKKGVNVTHLILSQVMPNEISGITMPVPETHSMSVFDNDRLASMKDGDILFLDEVLKAQQPVLSACLTLVQERRMMSGRKLPDVMIVAAANPLPTPASLPLEIRQRFMFVDVKFNRDEWVDYMLREHGVDMVPILEFLVTDGSSTKWNALTPRTATKLVEWIKAVADDKEMLGSVISYCEETFGNQATSIIKKAVTYAKDKGMASLLADMIDKVSGDDNASTTMDYLSLNEMKKWLKHRIQEMDDDERSKLMEMAKDFDMGFMGEIGEEQTCGE